MEIEGGITTLYVADVDRSVRFYTETLGLRLRRRAEDKWAEVAAGNSLSIGLHKAEGGGPSVSGAGAPPIKIGLHVAGDIHAAVERLSARGVEFDGPVLDDDGPVRLAFFSDPDGNPLYLFELALQTV